MNKLASAGFKERKDDPALGILEDNTKTKGMNYAELKKYFKSKGITIMKSTTELEQNEEIATKRKYLRELLESHIVQVTFTKKDGTTRKMSCTLDPSKLPKRTFTETKKVKKSNDNVLAVYETTIKEWRSFNLNSVTEFTFSV